MNRPHLRKQVASSVFSVQPLIPLQLSARGSRFSIMTKEFFEMHKNGHNANIGISGFIS